MGSFAMAIFIAFATGTSWGTMTILFPLMMVPSYEASGGDATIFYGVTSGILAGAVAGDHASPISDTTIISAMASRCEVLAHVKTQAPYTLVVAIWSILVGTIPSGMGAFSNGISLLLGFVAMVFMVVCSAFTINETGRFDVFTELYLRFFGKNNKFLLKLKEDTKKAFETGEPCDLPESEDAEIVKGSQVEQAVTNDVELANSTDTGVEQAVSDVELTDEIVADEPKEENP